MGDNRLVPFACALHASTDFREKLYKVIQYACKIQAIGTSADSTPARMASTLSQSRGIFKICKWVNNIDSYNKSSGEGDATIRFLKQAEAYLNTLVTVLQDAISIDKLCGTKAVGARFVWVMNFLDLVLSLLLAGLAAHGMHALRVRNVDVSLPNVRKKVALLQLELCVRVADAVALIQETSIFPDTRRFWPTPSKSMAMRASLVSACCATLAVAIKKWAALPEQLLCLNLCWAACATKKM